MVDGMKRVEDQGFEYVAIFDADFEPPEDFFYNTVGVCFGAVVGRLAVYAHTKAEEQSGF
jgi:hypothetical protein